MVEVIDGSAYALGPAIGAGIYEVRNLDLLYKFKVSIGVGKCTYTYTLMRLCVLPIFANSQ